MLYVFCMYVDSYILYVCSACIYTYTRSVWRLVVFLSTGEDLLEDMLKLDSLAGSLPGRSSSFSTVFTEFICVPLKGPDQRHNYCSPYMYRPYTILAMMFQIKPLSLLGHMAGTKTRFRPDFACICVQGVLSARHQEPVRKARWLTYRARNQDSLCSVRMQALRLVSAPLMGLSAFAGWLLGTFSNVGDILRSCFSGIFWDEAVGPSILLQACVVEFPKRSAPWHRDARHRLFLGNKQNVEQAKRS